MLSRDDKNRLTLKSLDLEIFIGELFEQCRNGKEVEWLREQLDACVEGSSEVRLDEVEGE